MDDILTVLIVVGGLFVLAGFVADSISRVFVRRRIADRELSPEQIEALLRRRVDPESALKWGILAVSLGLAFVVIQFLPEDTRGEPVVIGLVLIFAGAALFLYRWLVRRHRHGATPDEPAPRDERP